MTCYCQVGLKFRNSIDSGRNEEDISEVIQAGDKLLDAGGEPLAFASVNTGREIHIHAVWKAFNMIQYRPYPALADGVIIAENPEPRRRARFEASDDICVRADICDIPCDSDARVRVQSSAPLKASVRWGVAMHYQKSRRWQSSVNCGNSTRRFLSRISFRLNVGIAIVSTRKVVDE